MIDILTEGGVLLGDRDYTMIVDNSELMAKNNEDQNLWLMIENATLAIANKCEAYDLNGISIYLYADTFSIFKHVNAHQIAHIFQTNLPKGKSQLAPVLKAAIEDYFQRRTLGFSKSNGETFIVILASRPDSPEAVEDIIINAANQISHDEELAILFIQVGLDEKLRELLIKWDSNLQANGAKFDICDSIQIEQIKPNVLEELLLEAITE